MTRGVVAVSVIGATGYAGAELVRLLSRHPRVRIAQVTSESHRGQRLNEVYPHLAGSGEAVLAGMADAGGGADAVFLALPHGLAMTLAPCLLDAGARVIDLGADFRLRDAESYRRWYEHDHADPTLLAEAVYGLPELRRREIPGARLVANPGCYPTTAVLGLAPALQSGWVSLDGIVIDAKSGVSGAGRSPSLTVHFGEVNENLRPYNLAGVHRHTPEIEQELGSVAGRQVVVSFNPHLVPMTRGILCTSYLSLQADRPVEEFAALYREFYAGEPFVHVLEAGCPAEPKYALGSNHCFIGLAVDRRAGRLIVTSALDNLVKGAAGQAVQNLNLLFGMEETAGLDFPGLYP